MNKKSILKEKVVKRVVFYSLMFFFLSLYTISFANSDAKLRMDQLIENKIVTLNMQGSSIKSIILEIQKQSGLSFIMKNEVNAGLTKNVSLKIKGTVKEALNRLLNSTGFTYVIIGETINIVKSSTNKAKKITITGKVIDANKAPIAGATVIVVGTTIGAITDGKGAFSITMDAGMNIEISCVGMKSVINTYNATADNVVITMEADALAVEDVIVTGYQKINKKLFTGSATTVNAAKVMLKGSGDLSTSLQGKASGLQISNVSSTFGTTPVMTIRGNSSINGNNKPLWVIDGVVLEDLTQVSADDLTSGNLATLLSSGVAGLNPDDIKSFEILKDVSATSLYGAQAMNGVIVITTKEGRKDNLSVNYSGSIAVKQRPKYSEFDIMNSADEMSIYKELANKGWIDATLIANSDSFGSMGKMFDEISKGNINWGPNGSLNEDFLSEYAEGNTDWFDILFKDAIVNQHSISVSGGGKRSTFYASMSYYGEQGMAITSDKVDKYTATLRGNFDISKKVKLGLKLNADVRDQVVPGTKDRTFDAISGQFSRDFDLNPFNYVLNTSRSMRAHDDNGDLEYFRKSFTDFNILHELENNYVDMSVRNISAQADLEITPIKQLKIRGTLQYRVASTLSEHKVHETSNQAEAYRADYTQGIIDANRYLFTNPDMPNNNPYSILPEGGFYNTDSRDLTHLYFRATADYNPVLNDANLLNIFVGFEANKVDREQRKNDGWGYIWDRGGVVSTHNDVTKYLSANGQTYFSYDESRDRRISAFLNTAYSFKGKYVFNAGFRYDGSNLLGSSRDARYLPSWNVSGAWNMHEESFMRGVNFINVLKPKVSYGFNGIMGPNSSAELEIYANQTLRPTDNEIYNEINGLRNEDLTWEKMSEFNIGFEFELLNSRIRGDFAYYNRKSVDLIDIIQTSGIGGIGMKYGNVGDMKSSGYEIFINTVNIRTKNFEWNSNFNFSFHDSEITKLHNNARISSAVSNLGAPMLGFPQRGLFSIRFAGLDDKGIPTFYDENNDVVYDMDLQSRDDITKVLKYEGSLEPKGYGGFNNSFRYKGWTMNVGFVYKYGNKIRLDDEFFHKYDDYSAFSQDLKNRWMVPGDENKTTIPAILDQRTAKTIKDLNTYQMYNKSTERVAKGDFIRLKDITLQYALPGNWLDKTFINSARVSLQATNLWLLYSDDKLNGIDPEFYLSGGVSLPVSTTYTFSLSLSF